MGTRGRKSAAELSVIGADSTEVVPRLGPPPDLTPEEAHEWRVIIENTPAESFSKENSGLLAQYVRHLVSAKRIASIKADIEAQESLNLEEYDRILKMQERESRCLASLATKMRLSQQSTYDRQKRRPPSICPPHEWRAKRG